MAHILTSVTGAEVDRIPIRRALLSVSDKTGLLELARLLAAHNVELLSTGGTAKAMRDAGLRVIDVSEYTGSPEILDGRVKTLHPKVHGGLLGVRGNPKHEEEMAANGIGKIDLVVMNLYAFEATVASGADFAMCVENIDIGGPSMLRSSAKNHKYVSILCNPSQYAGFIAEFTANQGEISLRTRQRLAGAAFATSAKYDAAIGQYFSTQNEAMDSAGPAPATAVDVPSVPSVLVRAYEPFYPMKYGCNPHQKPAAIYRPLGGSMPFAVVHGTPGYINLLDALNAWQLVRELRQVLDMPAAASFKHVSPAGVGLSVPLTPIEAQAFEISDASVLSPVALAYIRARNADPLCSFGDFVAVSDTVDLSLAQALQREVCDGIIAPGFEPAALEILCGKKKGAFILLQGNVDFTTVGTPQGMEIREVDGALFAQRRNNVLFTPQDHPQQVVSGAKDKLTSEAVRDLVLASIAIKYTQSNSVGYAVNGMMTGVGAGQQSRVDCVSLAGRKTATWYLRQHPKTLSLPFKSTVKRQERVNARVKYLTPDWSDFTAEERRDFFNLFESEPEPLTHAERSAFLRTLQGVALASDAFFPFRDSLDTAVKYGVQFVAQPGGSVADSEVIGAATEYGMTMMFTNLRLFHH